MKGDCRNIEGSGAVFYPIDLGRQRVLFHCHISFVEAGSLLFVIDELACSLGRRAQNRPSSS